MRMKMKRFFGILLGLALVLGLLPGMSVTAYATEPSSELWVGDTQVVGGETQTTSGTGWSYDATTKTLTLSGATINGVAAEERIDAAIYAENMNLTIDVTGDSTVTGPNGDFSTSAGIYVKRGNLTITGNKKLTVKGGEGHNSYGVLADVGNVTVDGTLEATGGEAIESCGVHANNVTVDGTLTATGGEAEYSYGVYAAGDVTVSGTLEATGGEANGGNPPRNPESCGVYAGGDVTVSGTLEATGGIAKSGKKNFSYGVCAYNGNVAVNGTGVLTATGGIATGVEANDEISTTNSTSYGVYAKKGVTVDGTGVLTATGGEAGKAEAGTSDLYVYSYGVYANDSVTVTGTLDATGGEAKGFNSASLGVYADGGNVTVNGTGVLTATGGDTNAEFSTSYGVCAYEGNVTATGVLTATAGAAATSLGVYAYGGNVTVNATGALTATGNYKAIEGTVINAIAGTGWTNTAGTEGAAHINVDEEGRTFDSEGFKKVQFPPPAAKVKTAPTANALTNTGSAQELVTAGEAEGGTMNYALGTDETTVPTTGWSTAIPKGTDAGTYYVWYKAAGDATHVDSDAACVPVPIQPANGGYYNATGTENPTVYQGGGSATPFTVKNLDEEKDATACEDCVGVKMDSKDSDFLEVGTDYTKETGSVIITLTPAYLDTLALGPHTLYVYFSDDSIIEIPFTLKASTADPTDTPSPTQSTEPTGTPSPTQSTEPTDTPSPTQSTAPTDTPSPTQSTEPTGTPSPTQSTAPTDTPSPWQPTVTPEYGPKKAWNFPKTGDSSPIGLWIGMAVFGAAGIAALALSNKRKK